MMKKDRYEWRSPLPRLTPRVFEQRASERNGGADRESASSALLSATRRDQCRRHALFTVAVIITLLTCTALHAQGGRSGDNNLYPQPELPLLAGPEIGVGIWSNKGTFAVSDSRFPCAVFIDGDGVGPVAG